MAKPLLSCGKSQTCRWFRSENDVIKVNRQAKSQLSEEYEKSRSKGQFPKNWTVCVDYLFFLKSNLVKVHPEFPITNSNISKERK